MDRQASGIWGTYGIDQGNATGIVQIDVGNNDMLLTGTPTSVSTRGGDDTIRVGSKATPGSNAGGDVNGINGLLTLLGGDGTDALMVDDSGDSAPNAAALTATRLTGLGMAGGDPSKGISYAEMEALAVSLGSGSDTMTIESTHAGTTSVSGNGGDDTFYVGSTPAANIGNLDRIAGPLTISGGANPAGTMDTLYINDRAKAGNFNYLLTPTSLTNEANPDQPGLTRPFAGVFYDGTMESVRLDGTDQANVFDVQPSLSTKFYIDGNLPAPGTVIPDEGDYLKLDTETTHTRGRHLNITARGDGSWTFTSGHKPVEFESIEKFNHVDIVAVGADAGRKSKPLVRVYDAETMELKFEFPAYKSSHAGGVRVAAGDIDLDGLPDVVTVPGARLAPEVRVFNGSPMAGATGVEFVGLRIAATRTYGASFAYGAQVAVGDVNGDGCPDIVTAPSRGACTVKVFQSSVFTGGSLVLARSFNAFRDIRGYNGGGTLVVADLDGKSDGNRRADILVASGSGMPAMVRVFDVTANASSYQPIRQIQDPNPRFRGGLSITAGDVNGDGILDIITGAGPAGSSCVRVYNGNANAGSTPLSSFPAFAGPGVNVNAPVRVLARDIDGDGKAEILAAQGPDARSTYQIKRFKPLSAQLVDDLLATCPDFSGGGLFLG